MKVATAAEMDAEFRTYLKASEDGAVVVTQDGKPVAVLLGLTDAEEIERLSLAYSPRFRELLERSRQSISSGSGIEHADFWNRIEPAPESDQSPGP